MDMDRRIAKLAARNCYRGKGSPSDEDLLVEARHVDTFKCSENDMLVMLRAEYRRVCGQAKGGVVTGVRRRSTRDYQRLLVEQGK